MKIFPIDTKTLLIKANNS